MNRLAILDFNRTLHNPETGKLFRGVRSGIATLKRLGYTVILITQVRRPDRRQRVMDLGIDRLVDKIYFVPLKIQNHFSDVIKPSTLLSQSVSIGDYLGQDIAFGNACGLQTIRVTSSIFGEVSPALPIEVPNFVAKDFAAAVRIVRDQIYQRLGDA